MYKKKFCGNYYLFGRSQVMETHASEGSMPRNWSQA